MNLDVPTVFASSMLTSLICTLILVLLWSNNRYSFAGTGLWVIGSALQTAALFMFLLSGKIIPAWIEIALFNPMVVAGMFLAYRGLEDFFDKKGPHLHNYLLLAVFIIVQAYFTFFEPDLTGRIINSSVMLMIISFQCLWLLLYRVAPGMRTMTRTLGIVFVGYCIVSLFRIAQYLIVPWLITDFLQTNTFDIVIIIAYQMLFIILTFGLALIVNKRLLIDVRIQESKFSSVFHLSPYAIMLTNPSDGKIIEANGGFEKLSGYAVAEVMGKVLFELDIWEDKVDSEIFMNEFLQTGSVQEKEFNFRKKSGNIINGLISTSSIIIDNQPVMLFSIRDITTRKHADKDLLEYMNFLQVILNSIPSPVFYKDVNLIYRGCNKAYEKFMKIKRSDFIGKTVYDIVPKERADEYNKMDRELLDNPGVQTFESGFIGMNGETKNVIFHKTTYKIHGIVDGIVSVIIDVSDRKRLEKKSREAQAETERLLEEATQTSKVLTSIAEDQKHVEDELILYHDHLENMVKQRTSELEKEKIKAESANRAKIMFIANMSHELRTPLNAILGFSQLLINDPLLSSPHSEKMNSINQSGEQLLTLVNEIIVISKFEEQGTTKTLSTFCLQTLVDNIEKLFSQKARSRNLDLLVEQSSDIPEFIETDEMKLRQILFNLMDNAVKFTEKGKVHMRVSASSHEKGKVTLVFEVEDTGPGIPEDELENIFKPFNRPEKSTNTGGTGLGLALSRELAKIMDGDILVKSEVGKGSLFAASIVVNEKEELPVDEHNTEIQAVKDEIDVPLTVDDLKGLSDDLVEKVLSAISTLDQEELISLIDNAAELTAETSTQLRLLALKYQYDELIELFKTKREGQ